MAEREPYLTSGTDRAGNVWVARAEDAPTADHIAEIFRQTDHVRVTVSPPGLPLDVD